MTDFTERVMRDRRSLEEALNDLRRKYAREPTPELERTIQELEMEIERRRRSSSSTEGPR